MHTIGSEGAAIRKQVLLLLLLLLLLTRFSLSKRFSEGVWSVGGGGGGPEPTPSPGGGGGGSMGAAVAIQEVKYTELGWYLKQVWGLGFGA